MSWTLKTGILPPAPGPDANKRDIVSTPQRVYTVNAAGVQSSLMYDTAGTPLAIPLRDANGQFNVGTPTGASNPTTKSYVDTAIGNAPGEVSTAPTNQGRTPLREGVLRRWQIEAEVTTSVGRILYTGVYLKAGEVVNGMIFARGAVPVATSSLFGVLAEYDNAGAMIVRAVTVERSGDGATANTFVSWPFAASFTVTTSGWYYIGVGCNATTTAQWGMGKNLPSYLITAPPILAFRSVDQFSTPPPVSSSWDVVQTATGIMYACATKP